MHSFSTTLIALSMAGLTFAASHPLKRQTPAGCGPPSNPSNPTPGALAVRPVSDVLNGPITYVGIVSGVTHDGIDGKQDSILVTKDSNGNPLQAQQWEYEGCEKGGIVRPFNATQHCLAIESTNDETSGSRNSILDSYCSQVSAQYRTFVQDASQENYQGGFNGNLNFIYENVTLIIGDTAHGELQFFTSDSNPSGTPMQLQIVYPHEN